MPDLTGVWGYHTSEVIADPGAGFLRTGPGAPFVTAAISATRKDGSDASAQLALLAGARLLMQLVSDATKAAEYELSSDAIMHGTWAELGLMLQAQAPGTTPPNKNADILLTGNMGPPPPLPGRARPMVLTAEVTDRDDVVLATGKVDLWMSDQRAQDAGEIYIWRGLGSGSLAEAMIRQRNRYLKAEGRIYRVTEASWNPLTKTVGFLCVESLVG
jgi:hypothetical protein